MIRHGSSGASSAGGAARARASRSNGHPERRRRDQPASRSVASLRASATTSARLGDLQAQREVLGAQLLGAGQDDEALAEAREHRQRPLRRGCRPASGRRRRAARRRVQSAPASAAAALAELAEGPLAAAAVTRQLDQRAGARAGAASTTSRAKFTGVRVFAASTGARAALLRA